MRVDAGAFDHSFPAALQGESALSRQYPISPRREFVHLMLRYYFFESVDRLLGIRSTG